MNPSGNVFFRDEYDQTYKVIWETIAPNNLIDISTEIRQPYIWGEEPDAFIKNGILFRLGIITVQRQIIRLFDDGYEIVAEGASQIRDYIQMNYPCETGPVDNFVYHLDCFVTDDTAFKVTEGSRWADPADEDDADVVWGSVDSDGSVGELTATGGVTPLEWVDVWE